METELKSVLDGIRGSVDSFNSKFAALQTQVDAIDTQDRTRHTGGGEKSLVEMLRDNEDVARLVRDRKGAAVITFSGADYSGFLSRKTNITSTAVGAMTSGVLQIDRTPGITQEARQALKVRNVLTARPTTMQVVDFVKVATPMGIASPQTEASAKAENAATFTTASEKVQTIATWIPATRQVLDDFTELAGFINSSLNYYVDLAEEIQLLSGDGTGVNLHGLITQAAAFDTTLLTPTSGWNKIDIVGHAVQQIVETKEIEPTFVILNPRDWWGMRLQKDSFGRYILGDPQSEVSTPNLFNLTPVSTTSISRGTFLVGSGDPAACEIRDRLEMQIEISTSHSDFFTRNLLAVRAEKRLALVVKRPASFVYGSFSSSPA